MDERTMKKILLILITIFSLISCIKDEIIDEPNPIGCLNDECTIGDTTLYHINCNMNKDWVEMYFVKRTTKTLNVKKVPILDKIYYMNVDTTIINYESYKYTPDEFREVLIEKNKIQRDTTIFKYTPVMYCSWVLFDEIYKRYINE